MNILELQQRANILVNKVNEYEANLQGTTVDENTLINEHKYADIFCLRPVLKLLFGKTLEEKLDRYTVNDLDIRMIASSAPAWNRYFTFFKQSEGIIIEDFEQPVLTADGTIGGDTFAVGCFGGGGIVGNGKPYKATNPTKDRFDYDPGRGGYATLVYYYSEPLRATSFILNSRNAGDANFGLIPRTAELYGSNDVENWQDLSKYTLIQSYDFGSDGENFDNHEYLIGNVKSYKLYAFRVTKTNYANNRCMIGYFNIVGTVQKPITEPSYFISGDTHLFANSIDMWNDYNMTQLDVLQNTLDDRESLIEQGIRFGYSSNIKDALVTECQTANVFKWNTTDSTKILNNQFTTPRQVPGIVLYYLGNDYTGTYTATIPYNIYSSQINDVTYEKPPLYGAYYSKDETTSQVGLEMGAECCRIFIPGCSYFAGRLISPQMIWQPNQRVGDDNVNVGFNWQGQAIYHELVFKQRRIGCKDANVDFSEELESVADNDPQGLATRLVLAQMKPYYFNRPWFTELNELYSPDGTFTAALYKQIDETSTVDIYENQFADFVKAAGSPVYNLDTGEYTATNIDNYLYIDSSNELFNEGVVTIEIAVTMSSYISSNPIITNIQFMGINTPGNNDTTIRVFKDNYSYQGQTGSTINTLTHLRINVNKTTKEVVCYKQNYSTQAWEQFASFTSSNTFMNFRLATSEIFPLGSRGVINLKECKLIKDEVEYPFIKRVKVDAYKMNDEEFYNNYKLNYETWAKAVGKLL